MKHDTIPGRVYAIRCKAPTTVKCSRNGVDYTLISHPGDESEMYFTAISTNIIITSSGSYALQETFNAAPAASSGGGGAFDPAELQRKVVEVDRNGPFSDPYYYYTESDNRTIVRVTISEGAAYSAVLALPSVGKSYEMVFEITPLAENAQVIFGNDLGTPEWQWVDQAPKPTAWVVGKTYCFTVVYMDGVTAPIVALSYTRNAQS